MDYIDEQYFDEYLQWSFIFYLCFSISSIQRSTVAIAFSLFWGVSIGQLDSWCIAFACKFPLCDLFGDSSEHFTHIGGIFGRGLIIMEIFLLCKALNFFHWNCSLEIALITDENNHCRFISIALHLVYPIVANWLERLSVGQIKYKIYCLWIYIEELFTFIVGIDNSSKSLLACSIPNLKFDDFIIDINWLESEIDANGNHIIFIELIICKPEEKRWLAYCTITNHNKFILMVILPTCVLFHWFWIGLYEVYNWFLT